MDPALPLKPASAVFSIAGTPTASAAAIIFPGAGEAVYSFDNTRSSAAVWIGYGMSSTVAQNNAVIPNPGSLQLNVLAIAGGTVQSFTLNAGMFFSVIMEQGSGTVTGIAGIGT